VWRADRRAEPGLELLRRRPERLDSALDYACGEPSPTCVGYGNGIASTGRQEQRQTIGHQHRQHATGRTRDRGIGRSVGATCSIGIEYLYSVDLLKPERL
jgi:hypothetical protein